MPPRVSVPRRGSADGATPLWVLHSGSPGWFQSPEGEVLTVQRNKAGNFKNEGKKFQSPEGEVLTVQPINAARSPSIL